jgi:TATA-box binding protein (TBP) (component of TFIID and TFIIIB)
MKTEPKVSTITMSTKIPHCILNLTNIGKYLNVDDVILGVKYTCADLNILKGKYMTTIYKKAKIKDASKINSVLFYNQVSIVVNNGGNNVNVKVFSNGSCHLTGCKNVGEGRIVTFLVYNKLLELKHKTDSILLTKDVNGVLLDKDNLIYSTTHHQVVGYMRNGIYHIHKKEYDIDQVTGMFIGRKVESGRTRKLVNFDGEEIGQSKLILLKNKSKFYKNNAKIFYDYENRFVYYNNDMIIGKLEYTFDEGKVTCTTDTSDVLEVIYKCDPFGNNVKVNAGDIQVDINCINVCFSLGYTLNRQQLYDMLCYKDYICRYKPDSYSGIKLLYKIPLATQTSSSSKGRCVCTSKCTCSTITFLIFQSGNVIATGFKCLTHVQDITDEFRKLCEYYRKLKEQ